jgi:hypothetical protein
MFNLILFNFRINKFKNQDYKGKTYASLQKDSSGF